jgi:hypothetical protein
MGGERAGGGTAPLWMRLGFVAPLLFGLDVVLSNRRSETYRFTVGPALLILALLFAIVSDRLWSRRRSHRVNSRQTGPWVGRQVQPSNPGRPGDEVSGSVMIGAVVVLVALAVLALGTGYPIAALLPAAVAFEVGMTERRRRHPRPGSPLGAAMFLGMMSVLIIVELGIGSGWKVAVAAAVVLVPLNGVAWRRRPRHRKSVTASYDAGG